MDIHSTLVFTRAPENHTPRRCSQKRAKGRQRGDELIFFLTHPFSKLPQTVFPVHTQVTADSHRKAWRPLLLHSMRVRVTV